MDGTAHFMARMWKQVTWVTDQMFEFDRPVTLAEERVFRVFELFVTAALCYFCWTWALEVGRLGEGAFQVWTPKYFGSLLNPQSLALLNAGLITLLFALGWFRVFDRYMYLGALLLIHVQFVGRYWPDVGLHQSQMVGLGLVALALAFFFFDSSALRLRFTFGASYVLIGAGYVLAAVSKLRQGGWEWIDGNNFQMMLAANQVHRIARDRPFEYNALQELIMSHGWLGAVILGIGLLTELTAFLLCVRRFRIYSATAILLMHVGVVATMNIWFAWNMTIVLLLGYPWAVLLGSTRLADAGFSLGTNATGTGSRAAHRTP